jgi:hypothetical protein
MEESSKTQEDTTVRGTATALNSDGFVRIDGPFQTSDAAFDAASPLIEECRLQRGLPPLSIIGDFVIPPLDGAATRDFQTLHFDSGLPLDPKVAQDVARYTALYVPEGPVRNHLDTRRIHIEIVKRPPRAR